MVKVWFGYDQKALIDPSPFFDTEFSSEWLKDDFVKEMIMGIDKSEVISPQCIESPVFGQIPPQWLSGGVKACILLYEFFDDDDLLLDLAACGENCTPWLAKIFAMRDCTIVCSAFDISFKGYDIQGVCLNDNSQISNWEDWVRRGLDYIMKEER